MQVLRIKVPEEVAEMLQIDRDGDQFEVSGQLDRGDIGGQSFEACAGGRCQSHRRTCKSRK